MNKSLRDLMHKGLITCPPETSLGNVAMLLTQHHIHALVVVENNKPLGIISDFDLLAGEWLSVDAESLDTMRRMTARDLMTYPIATIESNISAEAAAQQMIEKQVHRMIVIENGEPAGVISISNFVASIAEQEPVKRQTVGDVMSETFLVCREETSVLSAARTMTQAGWRSIVVVNATGKLLGFITGRDLMHLAGRNVDEKLKVSQCMNRSLLTVDINASLQEAADLMIQNHRHRVVVIDTNDPDSFPLGVLSSFDIVAEMARPGSIWQS
ncbi:MAG TPA: CBS domain-containing protein [Anaerolineales bacterium]|nr:CBS domain-containing protein [Anaerolineales bacterium]